MLGRQVVSLSSVSVRWDFDEHVPHFFFYLWPQVQLALGLPLGGQVALRVGSRALPLTA